MRHPGMRTYRVLRILDGSVWLRVTKRSGRVAPSRAEAGGCSIAKEGVGVSSCLFRLSRVDCRLFSGSSTIFVGVSSGLGGSSRQIMSSIVLYSSAELAAPGEIPITRYDQWVS